MYFYIPADFLDHRGTVHGIFLQKRKMEKNGFEVIKEVSEDI